MKKKFVVMFTRIGRHHNIPRIFEATEKAALEAPIKDFAEEVLERENLTVTIVDDGGQINYGLLGEFTIAPY